MNQHQIVGNCKFFKNNECPHKEEEEMISLIREIDNMGKRNASVEMNPTSTIENTDIYNFTREIVNRKFCNKCKVFQKK